MAPGQRDFSAAFWHLWTVRFLIATLLAVALAFLPASGGAMAGSVSGPVGAGACHQMGADMPAAPAQGDMGRACAEHCMMQVSPPLTPGAMSGPSIANAIGAAHVALTDSRAPRAADPPDTPPPRR